MAAPTLAAVSTVSGSVAANTGTQTSASLTWQTGDVVVVMSGTEGAGSGEAWVAPTTTGTGLTFTAQQTHPSTSNCGAACYAAVASAGSTGTISIKNPSTPNAQNMASGFFVCRGSAGIGLSSQGASATRTVSLTPSGADGLIIWGVYDWAAAAVVAATPTATTHSASSPGPSASPFTGTLSGLYSFYIEELDDQTSAAAVSYGITGTATGPFTIIAIEVKAGSGGGATTTLIHPKAPSRAPIFRATF